MEWHKDRLPCGHDKIHFYFHPALKGGARYRCSECDKMKLYKHEALDPSGGEKKGQILEVSSKNTEPSPVPKESQLIQWGLRWGMALGLLAGICLGTFLGLMIGLRIN